MMKKHFNTSRNMGSKWKEVKFIINFAVSQVSTITPILSVVRIIPVFIYRVLYHQ